MSRQTNLSVFVQTFLGVYARGRFYGYRRCCSAHFSFDFALAEGLHRGPYYRTLNEKKERRWRHADYRRGFVPCSFHAVVASAKEVVSHARTVTRSRQ